MKMSIDDFITEYNWLCSNSEPQSEDIVKELYSDIVLMFEENCGEIPNFELIDGGRKIAIIK